MTLERLFATDGERALQMSGKVAYVTYTGKDALDSPTRSHYTL